MGKWRAVGVLAAVFGLSACGSGGASGVATNPPVSGGGVATNGPTSPSSQATGGVRTVLSPLGVNIRGDHAVTAPKLGAAAQGTELSVLDHANAASDESHGWFKVRGQTITGWMTDDSSLSAAGRFQPYSSQTKGFALLYPLSWTFAEQADSVIFRPQDGTETVSVRIGPSNAALGPTSVSGYSQVRSDDFVVCGVTGSLIAADRQSATSSSPSGSVTLLQHRQVIRLVLDGTHVMELAHNYDGSDQSFQDIANAVTFPFPQCQSPH